MLLVDKSPADLLFYTKKVNQFKNQSAGLVLVDDQLARSSSLTEVSG